MAGRVTILKPIRFIQGTVVKESESSIKEVYSGPYKDQLFSKLVELKEQYRQRWETQKSRSGKTKASK